jgi:hypothetical protein
MTIGTLTDLNVTENYAANTTLTETQLNTAMTSIESTVNTTALRNLEQLAKDSWGNANYTFDSDGAANMTNTLFDKQTAVDYYNGGNISIGTAATVAWAAVDAVNAAVSITPEVAGKFKATFNFTHRAASTATTEFELDIGFRITDGTDASYATNSGGYMAATAANSGEFIHPVCITHIFTWTTTTAKTVTLQYYNRTCTDVDSNVVSAAAATGEIYMTIEKI